MSKIQKNLEVSIETTASNNVVDSKLTLCNTGSNNITISSDAILLNDMYENYPFSFSGNLSTKCEFDFSGYEKNNITIAAGNCVNKIWNHNQECSFNDVGHGNYSINFMQSVECYDLETNIRETVLLGANSSFVL